MNRISHLFKDTVLILDGSQGDFYRVKLSKNKTAWIMKSAVEEFDCDCFVPQFVTMNSETFKNASLHIIEFTGKLPYTIDETDDEIIFKVYNPFQSEDSVYTLNIKSLKIFIQNRIMRWQIQFLKLITFQNNGLLLLTRGTAVLKKGAIGCLGDKEKDINLQIAFELKEILTQKGINAVMTRECDANVSLDDRVKLAHDNCANIFVSIHLNSIPDIKMDVHKNRGTSVYYYNPNSKELAKSVQKFCYCNNRHTP